jgi:hypothetical protein
MPKAAVHKDDFPAFRQHDIGPPRKVHAVRFEAVTKLGEEVTNKLLRQTRRRRTMKYICLGYIEP